MKRYFLLLCLSVPSLLYPCTTLSFLDDNNDRIFGKSFDWYFDHGMLFVNKRNVKKTAMLLDDSLPLEWMSKYGNISFNQHGREFPLGGMNEEGLVVEIMVGPTEDIANSTEIRNVNEVQIIQYMLDSFKSIPEVKLGLENVRVARVSSDVHYLVCDKKSDCATVEFLDGKLVIHSGNDLPYNAFTNSSYEESANYAKKFAGLGGTQSIPSDSGSLSRFVRAASRGRNYSSGDSMQYVHSFLDQVALSGKWRIGYKGTKEIHFRAAPNYTSMKKIKMDQDFSCLSDVMVFPMHKAIMGDIGTKLEKYTVAHNQWLVNSNYLLPYALRQQIINYPEDSTACMETVPALASH